MRTKDELLGDIRAALASGAITRRDLEALIGGTFTTSADTVVKKKLSVAQSLFYVTGIILFAAVLSVIGQTWDGGAALHLFLTIVLGAGMWAVAYSFGKTARTSDIRQGLSDALLLTGSLLMITGGYIVTNLFGQYGTLDFFEASLALFVIAVLHIGLWRIIRRDLVYLLSILLGVAAIGAVLFGILREAGASGDVWALSVVVLAGLLTWATRVVARLSEETAHMAGAYDRFAIVLGLLTMYIASFGNYAWLWYLGLAGGILCVYYLSIVSRQKILLGTASVFLTLVAITLSFRYFAAFGATTSLVFSALAILGVAVLASRLNKKYMA